MQKGDPERDAAQLLKEVWGETWGDASLPIDPIVIAGRLGVPVLAAALAANRSGALVKRRYEEPVIYLNHEDAPTRRRSTCAHELGH